MEMEVSHEERSCNSLRQTSAERVRRFRQRQKLKNPPVKKIPKTCAQRSREYYQRQKLKKITEKKIPKTNAQRSKEYYHRQKLKKMNDSLGKTNVNIRFYGLPDLEFMKKFIQSKFGPVCDGISEGGNVKEDPGKTTVRHQHDGEENYETYKSTGVKIKVESGLTDGMFHDDSSKEDTKDLADCSRLKEEVPEHLGSMIDVEYPISIKQEVVDHPNSPNTSIKIKIEPGLTEDDL